MPPQVPRIWQPGDPIEDRYKHIGMTAEQLQVRSEERQREKKEAEVRRKREMRAEIHARRPLPESKQHAQQKSGPPIQKPEATQSAAGPAQGRSIQRPKPRVPYTPSASDGGFNQQQRYSHNGDGAGHNAPCGEEATGSADQKLYKIVKTMAIQGDPSTVNFHHPYGALSPDEQQHRTESIDTISRHWGKDSYAWLPDLHRPDKMPLDPRDWSGTYLDHLEKLARNTSGDVKGAQKFLLEASQYYRGHRRGVLAGHEIEYAVDLCLKAKGAEEERERARRRDRARKEHEREHEHETSAVRKPVSSIPGFDPAFSFRATVTHSTANEDVAMTDSSLQGTIYSTSQGRSCNPPSALDTFGIDLFASLPASNTYAAPAPSLPTTFARDSPATTRSTQTTTTAQQSTLAPRAKRPVFGQATQIPRLQTSSPASASNAFQQLSAQPSGFSPTETSPVYSRHGLYQQRPAYASSSFGLNQNSPFRTATTNLYPSPQSVSQTLNSDRNTGRGANSQYGILQQTPWQAFPQTQPQQQYSYGQYQNRVGRGDYRTVEQIRQELDEEL